MGKVDIDIAYISCCVLGPFVMNTEEEIKQALLDYELGQNGFENAKTWKSEYLKNG